MPYRNLIRALLALTAFVAASAVGVRAWIGPYQFGLSVNSPMNAESIFGAAILLLILTSTRQSSLPPAPTVVPLHPAKAALLLVIVLVAALWPTLHIGFVADDYSHLASVASADLRTIAHWFTLPAPDNVFFRPIAMVSYRIDALWAGYSPIRWHAAELALHILNALLLFALCRRLSFHTASSLFAATLFGIHGSRPEAVSWVAARFDLLATLFVLITLLLFLAYRERPRTLTLACILAGTTCGLLSKESAFVLPALMAALAWHHSDRRRETVHALATTTALTSIVFVYRWFVLGGIGGYLDQGTSTAISFNPPLALKALGLRLWAVLLVPINWNDPIPPVLATTLALALIALLTIAWRAHFDHTAKLGLLFTLIAALPVYHLLLIGPDLEKSRVIYLGSAGFAIFIAALVRNTPRHIAIPAAVAILCFHCAALRHNFSIWDRASRIHLAACDYVGAEATRLHSDVVAVGMPNIWNGVYMLRAGLPECAAIRHSAIVHMAPTAEAAAASPPLQGLPIYVWDDTTARIVPYAR